VRIGSVADRLLASIPNTLGLLEYVVEERTTLRHHLTEPIHAVDGRVAVPEAPGLGLTIHEEGLARYRMA
jgi:L-alanine-DL-glutamate epimerase-like enolase superfamily enzyme